MVKQQIDDIRQESEETIGQLLARHGVTPGQDVRMDHLAAATDELAREYLKGYSC